MILECADDFAKDFSSKKILKEGVQNFDENPFRSSKYKGVFYHGSKIDINVFDPSKIGSATDEGTYGKGFYFSDNEIDAGRYGKNITRSFISLKSPAIYETGDDFKSVWGDTPPMVITSSLIATGCDGVIIKDNGKDMAEYVVFNYNQIMTISDEDREIPSSGLEVL